MNIEDFKEVDDLHIATCKQFVFFDALDNKFLCGFLDKKSIEINFAEGIRYEFTLFDCGVSFDVWGRVGDPDSRFQYVGVL